MIIFGKMELRDFGPFEQATFDWGAPGLTLIRGENQDTTSADSNGSGKSHLFKGLSWILYGKVIDGENSLIRIGCKAAFGTLDFIVDDSYYRIERKLGAKGQSLSLYQEGVVVGGATMAPTQEMICKVLDMDFTTFRSTVLYGQGDVERFASATTTDADRKLILRRALRLDELEVALEWVKGRRAVQDTTRMRLSLEIPLKQTALVGMRTAIDTKRATITKMEADALTLREQALAVGGLEQGAEDAGQALSTYTDLDQRLKDARANRTRATEQKGILSGDLRSARSSLETSNSFLADRQRRLERRVGLLAEIDQHAVLGNTLPVLTAAVLLVQQDQRLVREQITQLTTARQQAIDKKVAREADLAVLAGGNCPTCGTSTTAASVKKKAAALRAEMEAATQEELEKDSALLAARESESGLVIALNAANGEVAKANEALTKIAQLRRSPELLETEEACRAKITDYQREVDQHQGDIIRLTQEAEANQVTLQETDETIHRLEAESAERESLRTALHEIEVELAAARQAQTQLAGYVIELDLHRGQLADMEAGVVQAEQALEQILLQQTETILEMAHLEFWIKGFGNQGLTSFLLDTVLGELTEAANGYLGILADGDITIRFDTQSALKSGALRDRFRIEVDIEGAGNVAASGGQWKKIEIACGLALMDLVARRERAAINILLLDECLDGLDSAGQGRIIDLLMHLRTKRGAIFVITHSAVLPDIFERVVIVRKTERTAVLV